VSAAHASASNTSSPPPFDATALERKLRTMWTSSAGEPEPRSGAAYRAAMCNLLVAADPGTHARTMPVLVDVTGRHPSRLFLLEIEDEGKGAPAGLTGDVGAVCHLRPAGGTVCSEQIFLKGPRSAGPLVPSAVRALLVRARDLGYSDREAAATDPDLVPLAGEPAFQEWLASLEKSAAS